MDALRGLLEDMKQHALQRGHTLGLFQLLIGRQIRKADGTPVARGLSWRELAALLKKVRWDKRGVVELGLDPAALPPRDRQHYWYAAISKARVDSAEARKAGDVLVALLKPLGYHVP
jgi:hypothetical protein